MKKIKKSIFICRIAGMACMLALFSCLVNTAVHAAENVTDDSAAVVVSSRTTEAEVYIYIKGVGDITSGTVVQVGNTLCADIQVAAVASMGLPIKTTILFDNSLSLSNKWGGQAKELVAGLIDSHAEDEEFRIATFADGLDVVADFSTEYEDLKAMVDKIEFLNQDSYLTDILYDLLKQDGDSNEAGYTRYVIITDGADDNDIKYTQTELTDLMKNSGVVIHTVGVKRSNNNTLLENLFSYARLTGGTYKIAEKGTNVEDIRDMINEDYSLLCLKLNPQADIMDGGRKEAKLSLNTSGGEVVLTASLQMPFADVSSMSPESTEAALPSATVPAVEKSKPVLPSIAVEQQPGEENEKSGKIGMIPVIVISAVVFAIIIIAILLVLRSKKKKQVDVVMANSGQMGGRAQNNRTQASPERRSASAQSDGHTVKLGGQQTVNNDGHTMRLQSGTGQPAARQSFIILTDISNPQRSFRAPIETRIVIGRESGDIILGHDAAVSYTHCEIIKKGNLFYVNDLKSSNGTFYGNMRVYSETPIMNGGILEVGTSKYKITIESETERH
ncbi:MAG: FHA domain-containing protein [Lachnospiraceae bacterium]|nr:FHA domain-containing protein [Lachnospiraceae bacterium]